MTLGDDPTLFWHPWVGHWFPGITPDGMETLHISQYVGMHKFVQVSTRTK